MIATGGGVVSAARICLNAVYVKPYRAQKAEEVIVGKAINEENAEKAGSSLISDADPMTHNRYMVQIARTLVKRTILACK